MDAHISTSSMFPPNSVVSNHDVAVVLNNLYKKTPLQTTFSGNFLALMNNDGDATGSALVPQRFTLRAALDFFLDFRFETIRRKSAFQLSKVEARSHIVDGLLVQE